MRSSPKLGDVAEFIRGITYKPGDVSSADDPSAIPCMRTKNIQHDLEDEDLVYIPRQPIKSDKFLQAGDILVSSANSWNLVGKCSWVPALNYEATFGGFTSVLRATSKNIWPRYMYHWFSTDRIQALARSCGQQTTNISNLNQARCLELEISLPPLDEQRRIAAILDKADALRRKRKRALELLDTLTQSIFLEMFGDPAQFETTNLVECCASSDDIRCGPFGTQLYQSDFQLSGVPLWGIKHVNAQFRRSTVEFLTPNKAELLGNYSLQSGDLVMTRKGTIGNVAIYPNNFEMGIMHSDLLRARLDAERVLPEFMAAQLRFDPAIRRQISVIGGGAIMAGINVGKLKKISVFVPPVKLQGLYVLADQQNRRLRDRESRDLNLREEVFASLQHRAFSGQL